MNPEKKFQDLFKDLIARLMENNMRRMENVYNFHAFVTVVQTFGGAPKTVEMQYHDFVKWDKRVSGGKTFFLTTLVVSLPEKMIRKFFGDKEKD
ncbi:hypothetical protein RRG08_004991 [Elysia crispata]|uniref:Uncharacterized protein n=2 Tax=Elysia crispata TaxID=231223 RepID=A0AAE1E8A2_9GAST|nr:hypothetical protein RRG08_004991 [Elysia crispata]